MPLTLAAKKTTDDNKKSCDHCRELVGKFIDEFKLTDRGLFEGGDTDWEIKNLKDYKKSEVRFIEITEKIYKCKVDHVTRLLEEVEENLEDFWRDHWQHVGDSNELDSYLCVSLKKVCCPYGFFGAECSPCQSGEEATAGCSGHGSCNGNGTRGGTGKCKCDEEYRGSFCEECKKGYQREEENQTCVDIDECAQKDKPNLCEDGKYCDNNPGYYSCRKCHEACNNLTCNGPEPENCTGDSCAEGYLKLLDGDSVIGCKKDEEEEEEENLGEGDDINANVSSDGANGTDTSVPVEVINTEVGSSGESVNGKEVGEDKGNANGPSHEEAITEATADDHGNENDDTVVLNLEDSLEDVEAISNPERPNNIEL